MKMSSDSFKKLTSLLSHARHRWRLGSMMNGLFLSLIFIIGIAGAAVLSDQLFYLNPFWRFVFFILASLGIITIVPLVLSPLVVRRPDEWIARRIEIHNPGLDNRLINCLQLAGQEICSPEIHTQLTQDALTRLESTDRSVGINRKRMKQAGSTAAALMLLFVVYTFISPGQVFNSLSRILFPWADIQPLYDTQIFVEPGNAEVPEGSSFTIKIRFEGKIPYKAAVLTSVDTKSWTEETIAVEPGSNEVTYRFDAVSTPFNYCISAGDARSSIYHVTILPRPVIEELSIALDYPAYTGLADDFYYGADGSISAYAGTRVILSATTDIPIEKALINHRHGENIDIVNPRIVNEQSLRAEFKIEKKGWYTIKVFTAKSVDNSNPVHHSIDIIPDQPPQVTLPLPGRDIPDVMVPSQVPCLVKAIDDLGLAQVELCYRETVEDVTKVIQSREPNTPPKKLQFRSVLDVTSAVFSPGQTLELYASAIDSLGQRGGSQRFVLKLVEQATDPIESSLPASKLANVMDEMREPLDEHNSEEKKEKEKEKILDTLDDILQKQKDLIPPTEDLLEIPEEQRIIEQEEELQRLAQAENRLLDEIKDFNEYLKNLSPQKFDNPSLVDEWNEIIENVERAEESLIGNAVEIALESEEAAVWSIEQLEERIESELESWLPDKPDRTKWNLEDAPEDVIDDISMVDLPEELEDLIGELIEDEEDVTEETEDLSSNWASADLEEGWDVMDGQISNYSAKGKTGNTLPESTEARGRSGEGRTGKSGGEFVEKYAQHKDDRQTPARMRDEPFEDAVVEELDNKPPSESTGGGKKSGMGPEGFTGKPPLMLQEKLNRLSQKQSEIRDKAEKLDRVLNSLYLSPKELVESIRVMEQIEEELTKAQLDKVVEKQRKVISNFNTLQRAVTDPVQSLVEQKKTNLEKHEPVATMQDQQFPEQYAEALNLYFRSIAEY